MKKLLVIALLIAAMGCTQKYSKPSDETVTTTDETVKEEVITPVEVEEVEEVREIVDEDIVISEEEIAGDQVMSIEEQAREVFKDVLFDYDRYDIKPESRPALNAVAKFLNDNSSLNIVVEGHCDERGTNEYNLALGEKRAKSAKDYLISLGVSPSRMIIITFGEEKPVCSEQSEACWQNNRRAHFVAVTSRFGN